MQQDKQGTAMNTISQWTASKSVSETLTLTGELAIVFLEVVGVHAAQGWYISGS